MSAHEWPMSGACLPCRFLERRLRRGRDAELLGGASCERRDLDHSIKFRWACLGVHASAGLPVARAGPASGSHREESAVTSSCRRHLSSARVRGAFTLPRCARGARSRRWHAPRPLVRLWSVAEMRIMSVGAAGGLPWRARAADRQQWAAAAARAAKGQLWAAAAAARRRLEHVSGGEAAARAREQGGGSSP